MKINTEHIPPTLAGSTIRALCHLYEVEAARPTDLAAATGITTAAVTGMIDRAEAQGLLRRKASLTDRRSYEVVLTRRGREMVARMIGPMDPALAVALDCPYREEVAA